MPSFFVKTTGKKKVQGGRKRKQIGGKSDGKSDELAAKMTRRQKLMAATEIHSDEEDPFARSASGSEAGSDVEYEDVHERNYREAKNLLEKIQSSVATEEEVSEKLRDDALAKTGTLMKRVADVVELEDDLEISYKAHRLTPLCVAFSPDANYVISSGKESSIVKYNVKTRKVVGVIKRTKKRAGAPEEPTHAHYGVIYAVAVSPDQKFIASGGYDQIVKIWNFDSLDHIKDLSGHRGPIFSLAFQLRTNNLFSSSQDRSVKMWDIDQLGLVDTMYGHQDGVQQIGVLSKQRVATVGGRDRTARLWKVEDESQLMFTGLSNCVSLDCVAMINEEHFATGSADGSIALWSFWKKRPIHVRKQAHGQETSGNGRWIVALAVLPYSDLLASGSNEGELKLWKIAENFRTLTPFFSYTIPGFINSINFAPNGKSIVVGAGKEHKDGRWWVDREARNQVVILPIRYTDESDDVVTNGEMASGTNSMSDGVKGIESGDSDDDEVVSETDYEGEDEGKEE
ncbi:hypothetical protein GCK72_003629 [Caenorhabditis remanei]|uniref:Uncharacterized protein n=1 Tax=Caenorhabditis remanei TaxID=31234 RepID=A0A6A5HA30_CAERE|nr:hypothetical protein GCK72_003629 [Caenorhabditis remanei]KAF1763684.1 hypothetical protein GCK72_003629 [Caenorhabditis remanei]